ncbi:hypothetical protein [Streptomyces sp. NPDC048637]
MRTIRPGEALVQMIHDGTEQGQGQNAMMALISLVAPFTMSRR